MLLVIFQLKACFVSLHVKQIGLRPNNLTLPRIKETSDVTGDFLKQILGMDLYQGPPGLLDSGTEDPPLLEHI